MIPDTTQRLIKRLLTSANNVVNARNDDARVAARGFLIARATELTKRRDQLAARMDAGWLWLDTNPDDPDCDTNEDRLIGWIKEYEAIIDALEEASVVWGGASSHAA